MESEKAVLALSAWSERNDFSLVAVAMGGCWGWRGRTGKLDGPDGERLDEKGPIPDLAICADREVFVMLDSNVGSNANVRAAQSALTQTLTAMNARVRRCSIPTLQEVNGGDDLIAVAGDGAMRLVLEAAPLATEVAVADAEAAINILRNSDGKPSADDMRAALDAIASVPDKLQREMLQAELAATVRGKVPKKAIIDEVQQRRDEHSHKVAESKRAMESAELSRRPLNTAQLIDDLEKFFAQRGHLPDGAALLLAYFTVNTYVFEVFDTTPYLSLESAVPGCGKSTVLRLLEAVCRDARRTTSPSEAAMFRMIDSEMPTLLIDEAEIMEHKSDRAELLKAIAHEGYKKGGQVARCVGDEHEIRWFNCYCPKAFAGIGGLSGALLDRSVVIHMEKAPRNQARRSTRVRALKRDSQPLIGQLKSYALQRMTELGQLYDQEPDSGWWPTVTDREAELYGPLLTHARLISASHEQRLLAVVETFTAAKAEIKSEDWQVAKAIAVLEVLKGLSGETFTPGDLIEALTNHDVWAPAFSKVRGADDKTRTRGMAAKVGYFLRSFRLDGRKAGGGVVKYDLRNAIDVLSRHVPENYPNLPNHPDGNHPGRQVIENDGQRDTRDTWDTSTGTAENTKSDSGKYPDDDGWQVIQ